MSTKHSEETLVHWKNYNFVHFFPHFDQKKSRIQQNCFGRSVKTAFLVSSEYLQVKSFDKMNTNMLSFLGFEQKYSRSLANVIRHTCQTCFSPVQQTFRGKVILVKRYTFLSIFWGFEQKKDRSLTNSIQHSCQVWISRVPQTLRGKTILFLKNVQICSSLWALRGRRCHPQE